MNTGTSRMRVRVSSVSYTHLDVYKRQEYEHQGYATEAVRAACRWAFEQPGVTAVEAETDPGNTASQAVLDVYKRQM